jgi:thiol-disulfide isomerase/thioredoxin
VGVAVAAGAVFARARRPGRDVSNKADREHRRDVRFAEERETERRKERLITRAAVLGFVLIAGGALAYVGLRGGHRPLAIPTAASAAPTPPLQPGGGAPRQIAVNIAEGSRVIATPLTSKLAALKGVPVVVNQWASWCPNCKAEFPFFQRESQRYARQVAFLGLDAQDQRSDAASFLKKFPVNYPSVFDQSAQQAASLGGGQAWPTTFFIDRTGKETFVHEGAYPSDALLEHDVRRYALGA